MAKAFLAVILLFSLFGTATAAAIPAQPKPARPDWTELKPSQQQVLAPLKEHWDELDTTRRQKWVKVANSYPKLTPDEQQRLQDRMRDWAKLSSDQRRAARDKYLALKKLSATKRAEVKLQWRQYQESLAKAEVVGGAAPTEGAATTPTEGSAAPTP